MSRLSILSVGALLLLGHQAVAEEPAATTVHDCIQGYLGYLGEKGHNEAENKALEYGRQRMVEGCFTQAFSAQLKKGGDEDGFLHARKARESWFGHIDLQALDLSRGRVIALLGQGADTQCLELGLKRGTAGWRIDSSHLCSGR